MRRKSENPSITWLEIVRRKRKLTQEDLSVASGISKVQISRYENGRRWPKDSSAQAIARALRVEVDSIFPPDGCPTPMDLLSEHIHEIKPRPKKRART